MIVEIESNLAKLKRRRQKSPWSRKKEKANSVEKMPRRATSVATVRRKTE